MSGVPSISSSISTAFQNGFGALDRGAVELVDGASDLGGEDSMLSGIQDLFMARVEVGAGAAMLRVYNDMGRTLDMYA